MTVMTIRHRNRSARNQTARWISMVIEANESGEDGTKSEEGNPENELVPAKKNDEKESEVPGTGEMNLKEGKKRDYEDSDEEKAYWMKYCMGKYLEPGERHERGMATLFVLVLMILAAVAIGHPLYQVNFKLQKVEYTRGDIALDPDSTERVTINMVTIDLFNKGLKKAVNVHALVEIYDGTSSWPHSGSGKELAAWYLDSEDEVGALKRYGITIPNSLAFVFTVPGPHTVVITVSWEDGSETFVSTLEYP